MINAAGALLELFSSGLGLHISGYSAPTPSCIKSNESPMGRHRFLRQDRYQSGVKAGSSFHTNYARWMIGFRNLVVRHDSLPNVTWVYPFQHELNLCSRRLRCQSPRVLQTAYENDRRRTWRVA
ncbi:hypothetical protein DE146DRAFT_329088 [Phaeosphaeria sp. MPI-PUGE-AT-0046c]|nr:hypothetical protein DE146DRAFT_329088 [Phaeosphaeria sp. MPI-PUGE-AT-0046c]